MAFNDLAMRLRQFAEERDWNQFHSPKNLAISISVEAAELLELFQWSRGRDDWDCMREESIRDRTAEELADILLYLVRFADKAGIDLEQRRAAQARAQRREVSRGAVPGIRPQVRRITGFGKCPEGTGAGIIGRRFGRGRRKPTRQR